MEFSQDLGVRCLTIVTIPRKMATLDVTMLANATILSHINISFSVVSRLEVLLLWL